MAERPIHRVAQSVTQDGMVAPTELTGLCNLSTWPAGMRVIVRRERPHPGAQLSMFEERDGWRYQASATNTATGQLAFLEAATVPMPVSKTSSTSSPASAPSRNRPDTPSTTTQEPGETAHRQRQPAPQHAHPPHQPQLSQTAVNQNLHE